jgi:hypothetical protein
MRAISRVAMPRGTMISMPNTPRRPLPMRMPPRRIAATSFSGAR